jgi:hypothetical protein
MTHHPGSGAVEELKVALREPQWNEEGKAGQTKMTLMQAQLNAFASLG